MKIPYGIADFAEIRRSAYFYVDKTKFLPDLESVNHLVFLRPRRMGKSALVSMLAHYYDLASANQFDELFRGLWVHDHPTPEKNAHVVLHLNLGSVRGNDEETVKLGFTLVLRRAIAETLRRYLDHGQAFAKLHSRLEGMSDLVQLLYETMSAVTSIGRRLGSARIVRSDRNHDGGSLSSARYCHHHS